MAQDTASQLNNAIAAARAGDAANARRLLRAVINADPDNETAWVWLAATSTSADEKRQCLQRVLQINPDNATARRALDQLGGGEAAAPQKRAFEPIQEEANPYTLPLIVIGVLVSIGVLGYIIFSIISPGGDPLNNNEIAAAITQTAIANQPTATSFLPPTDTVEPTLAGIIVSPDGLPTLPPTFTPTPTNTPTQTDTPTATAPALENYRLIYRSLGFGESEPQFVVVRADGSGEIRLDTRLADAAVSPDGQRVAFVRVVAEEVIQPTAAPTATPVPTFTPTPDAPPPDEEELDDEDQIGGQPVDPNTEIIAVERPTEAVELQTRILVEIFVAPLDDLEAARQITDLRTEDLSALAWTPDGEQILFVQDGTTLAGVPAGGGPIIEYVTGADTGTKSDPAMNHDSTRLAYASDADSPGLTEIYVYDLETGTVERVTDDTGSSYSPAWSPDGQIAFISDRSGDGDVYLIDADGVIRLVTFDDRGAEDRSPSWSRDSRWLAFSSNRDGDTFQIYLTTAQGTPIEAVTASDRNELAPVFVR